MKEEKIGYVQGWSWMVKRARAAAMLGGGKSCTCWSLAAKRNVPLSLAIVTVANCHVSCCLN